MRKVTFFICMFFLFWKVFFAQKILLPEVSKPFDIIACNDRMVITDEQTIFIYDLKDFKLIKKVGKQGEGPGEFLTIRGWSVIVNEYNNNLLIGSLGKISIFSKEGEFIKSIKTKPYDILCHRESIQSLGIGEFVSIRNIRGEKVSNFKATIYNHSFQPIKEFYHFNSNIWKRGKQYNPIKYTQHFRKIVVYKGKIFINSQNNSGDILVFDKFGKQLYTIENKFVQVKFTDNHKQNYLKDFDKSELKPILHRLQKRWIFPDYFPAWQKFTVTDDKIYIQTYHRNSQENTTLFYILDLDGKQLNKTMVPLQETFAFTPDPYFIKNNKLYQLVENPDEEEWELHVHLIK